MGKVRERKRTNRREIAAQQRAQLERERASSRVWGKVRFVFVSLFLLALLGAGGFTLYIYQTKDTSRFNTSYQVIDKRKEMGELIAANPEEGSPSKGFATRTDSKFYLICEANVSKNEYVFAVPERVFFDTPINTKYPAEVTRNWELVSTTEADFLSILKSSIGLDPEH